MYFGMATDMVWPAAGIFLSLQQQPQGKQGSSSTAA